MCLVLEYSTRTTAPRLRIEPGTKRSIIIIWGKLLDRHRGKIQWKYNNPFPHTTDLQSWKHLVKLSKISPNESIIVLKTLWQKEKILNRSDLSFCQNVLSAGEASKRVLKSYLETLGCSTRSGRCAHSSINPTLLYITVSWASSRKCHRQQRE